MASRRGAAAVAEQIARHHIETREGRPDADSRTLRLLSAVGTARVDGDAHLSLIGRAGTLTPHQAARANGASR